MRKYPLTILFLFMALLVSMSCDSPLMDLLPTTPTPTRPPITCPDIPVAKLTDIFANGGTIDEAIPWVEAASGTTPQVDEFYESKNRNLRWLDEKNKYTAYYDENGHLDLATLYLEYAQTPTLEEVLTCFGLPDRYRAYREVSDRKILYVNLYYPAIGISFRGWLSDGHTIPSQVEGWMPMAMIFYVGPVTIEQMISPLVTLKPWPGSLEAMEIEEPY